MLNHGEPCHVGSIDTLKISENHIQSHFGHPWPGIPRKDITAAREVGIPISISLPSAALGKPNCKVDLKQDCDSKVARGMRICHRIRVGKCILCIPHLCYDHNGDSITQGLWAVRVALGRPWWKVPQ